MTQSRSNSQSSVKSSTSQKKLLDLNKIQVYLEYTCFVCGIVLGSPKSSIDHAKKIHGYIIQPRPENQKKRPRHHRFAYVKEKGGLYTIVENACPSCWFHSPEGDLEALNEHVREEHNPVKINDQKDSNNVDKKKQEVKKEEKEREQIATPPKKDKGKGRATVKFEDDVLEEEGNNDKIIPKDLARKFEEIIDMFKHMFD